MYIDVYRNFRPPPGGATAYMVISHVFIQLYRF